jgi:hypothetical protein
MEIVRTNKVQLSYFFKNDNIKSFELISKLYERLSGDFKTEPQTISVPSDAPKEFPRCIWSSPNITLTFSLLKLDLIFNIGTGFEWENQVVQYADRIKDVLLSSQIEISRIGIVTDNIAKDDLHDVLNDRVKIDKFQTAKELNISWVENVEKNLNYNVWTNISIDENSSNYSVVFDVNSVFGEDTIDMVTALNDAVDIMEGKMKYVI